MKECVKDFVESNLKLAGLDVEVPLRNVSLKNYQEIDRILDLSNSAIHASIKELR